MADDSSENVEAPEAYDEKKPKEQKKKKPKKKKKPIKINWKKLAVVIVLGMGFIIYKAGTAPRIIMGSQFFGVCRTYVELNVQFPSELRFIDIRERKKDGGILVEVEYMTVDSYGQHIAHRGSCMFRQDKNKKMYMESYRLKRGVSDRTYSFAIEDPEKVEAFNITVPFLRKTEINLLVRGPANSLGDLSPAK